MPPLRETLLSGQVRIYTSIPQVTPKLDQENSSPILRAADLARSSGTSALYRDSQPNRIIWRMDEILSSSEITLRGLDGGVTE